MNNDDMLDPDIAVQIRQAQQRLGDNGNKVDPYLKGRIQQAWREEYARCMEDYKNVPIPHVLHEIKQRAIDAKDRAVAEYMEMKARQAAEAAKDGNT
jgi:hypothetical protein